MPPVSELDPSFHNQDYHTYVKNKMLKLFHRKTTGSALSPETIDGSFHYFDLMNKSENKDNILEAQLSPAQFIIIALTSMKKLIHDAPNPF